jgi:hypothetical protein
LILPGAEIKHTQQAFLIADDQVIGIARRLGNDGDSAEVAGDALESVEAGEDPRSSGGAND